MINWREAPLVRIVLALMAGIISADSGWNLFTFPLLFLLISIAVTLWLTLRRITFQHRWLFGITILVFWFCTGHICYTGHIETKRSDHYGHYLQEEQLVSGFAIEAPVSSGQFTKFTLQVTGIGTAAGDILPCSGRLLVYLKRDSTNEKKIRYGDEISFISTIIAVPPPLNPDAFDYAKYLFYKNTQFQVFVEQSRWSLSGFNQGSLLWTQAYLCRDHCIRVIHKYLGSNNESAVASALILGYDEDISEEIKTAYIQTGSMHILAVSGMHVGLIYLLLVQFFKRIKLRKKWWVFFEIIVSLSVVWGFTLLTGASASVLRASTMFSFLMVGLKLKRFINIYNTLAASVFCLLLWNPFLLFDIGFQLSYSAVMGIVYFQQKFYKLLVFNNFVPDNIWQLISISFAAQIGTLPLSLYYFHAFPTWFWLSGLVAIPVSSLALYAGIVTLITDLVMPGVAEIAGTVFYWLVWLMNESIFFFQRFPFSTIQGIWLGFPEALLIVIIILLLVFVIETARIRGIIFCGTGICLLIASSGFKETKQYFKAELAIYHINRQTLIDWTEGHNVYSFSTASLPLTKENMAAQLHRWRNRATAMTHVDMDSTSAMGYGFCYTPPVIFFRDKTLAIVNSPILPFPDSTMAVDYLLLCGNAKASVPDILKSYTPGLIIADGSNSRYKLAQWKRESADAQIPFYATGESGAFMVSFE